MNNERPQTAPKRPVKPVTVDLTVAFKSLDWLYQLAAEHPNQIEIDEIHFPNF